MRQLFNQLLSQDVENALWTLTEKERGVLRMRYGLDDGEEKTLEEIGVCFNVRQETLMLMTVRLLHGSESMCVTVMVILMCPEVCTELRCCRLRASAFRQIEGKALRKLRQPDRQSTLAEYTDSADLVTIGGSKGRIKV